ncbi:AI-2E family transporter [Deinococcus cellulosilyticus]|uniref:AI-2E family transporter n=1 Tax=Deinococcus cellulosilyticus (strain DSM 18568 / NBRC 106333 / KACC 11606 / 5516J-15) TaxID=1223518 RepID=A0A511N4F3_DEIC1|nr:AI-2E family transporter [Deinococcus cellulosilyticus]GEM47750.1 AI-2E family transporter [Deinococcus cellulosilyticus NBRC 106333 = KACC 11606]
MLQAFQDVWRSPWTRVAVFVLLVYVLWGWLHTLASVLIMVSLAYLMAYLFNPLLDVLQKRGVRRGMGILMVLCILAGMVALLVFMLVAVFQQLTEFVGRLPEILQSGNELVQSTLRRIRGMSDVPMVQQYTRELSTLWKDNVAALSQNGLKYLQGLLQQSGSLVVSFTSTLVQVIFTVILSIYFMADYQRINQSLVRFFPERWQPRIRSLSEQFGTAVGGYLRGQFTIALLEGTLIWIGLALSGVPNALTLGFIAGLFGMVPYLGVIVSIVPALLLALSVGWTQVGLVIVVFVIANQIEGNLLSPWVLGRTTNLHPLTVLISLLVGVELMGIWGTLLAVPLAALLKLLLQNYYYPSRLYRSVDVKILPAENQNL